MNVITVGITGASGSVIAKKLLEYLSGLDIELNVVATEHGRRVFEYETGLSLDRSLIQIQGKARVVLHDNNNMFASIASGSYGVDCMAVVPCSMSTAGKLANACGDNLLVRAADVCLKERTRLVLIPRETPLHSGHLRNLLALSESGAVIVPPVPAFYDRAETFDEVTDSITGRILKAMGIQNNLYRKWGAKE